MELISDGLLILATATACFFCMALNRRLKRLQGAKDEFAATMATIGERIEHLQVAITVAQEQSAEASRQLGGQLKRAERLIEELDASAERVAALRSATRSAARDLAVDDGGDEDAPLPRRRVRAAGTEPSAAGRAHPNDADGEPDYDRQRMKDRERSPLDELEEFVEVDV